LNHKEGSDLDDTCEDTSSEPKPGNVHRTLYAAVS
jgi:hypothetical protein